MSTTDISPDAIEKHARNLERNLKKFGLDDDEIETVLSDPAPGFRHGVAMAVLVLGPRLKDGEALTAKLKAAEAREVVLAGKLSDEQQTVERLAGELTTQAGTINGQREALKRAEDVAAHAQAEHVEGARFLEEAQAGRNLAERQRDEAQGSVLFLRKALNDLVQGGDRESYKRARKALDDTKPSKG